MVNTRTIKNNTYVCMFVYSLHGNNIKNMKLGYNVYYVLFDLWYKWLLYISKALCVVYSV